MSKYNLFITSDANSQCRGSRGMPVQPDVKIFNLHPANFDMFVLIGGKGVSAYLNNITLMKACHGFIKADKFVAAICGAPGILANSGILAGLKATGHPDYKKIFEQNGVISADCDVTVSNKIITARDMHSADKFAETIYNILEN